MISPVESPLPNSKAIDVLLHRGPAIEDRMASWEAYVTRGGRTPLSCHPAWLLVMRDGLLQDPFCFEAVRGGQVVGLLPLAYLRSLLFGRFLVGLPYLNHGGVIAEDVEVSRLLIDRAVELADRLGVRYMELRHERGVVHSHLATGPVVKAHMRLALPDAAETLWAILPPKVRNQVRKAQKGGLTVSWGGEDLLPEFYDVFSRNMRDLGTPVFGRGLFLGALRRFAERAEVCLVRAGGHAAAAALLLHGWDITEVPSASSIRDYNSMCPNMLLYWSLIERSIDRGQAAFDFGRSSPGSGTFHFKRQWGAAPEPAEWQYYIRSGSVSDMRPEAPRNQRLIRLWKRLPVGLTRRIGPAIVRGIP